MAKFFGRLLNERGTEKHQIANESLSIELYYGSRDNSRHFITLKFKEDHEGNLVLVHHDGPASLNTEPYMTLAYLSREQR